MQFDLVPTTQELCTHIPPQNTITTHLYYSFITLLLLLSNYTLLCNFLPFLKKFIFFNRVWLVFITQFTTVLLY